MALIDKLKENQVKSEETPIYQMNNQEDLNELIELLKQTNDLNDLMRGYIRTNMDKSTTEKLTIETEIDNIKRTSQEVMTQMNLILTKQERLLQTSVEMLRKVLTDSHMELKENNSQTLQKMGEIEGMLNSNMNEIKNTTNTAMESISRKSLNKLYEIEQNTNRMISNAKKGIWINDWLDVAKYGLGTSIFVVPVYVGVKYLFSLFGVEMP